MRISDWSSDVCSSDLTFEDGSTLKKHVERSIGSRERPLSNEQLETKFMDQAKLVIGEAEARALLDLAWTIDGPGPAAAVAEASVPGAKLRTAALCTLHGRLTNDHGQGSAMPAAHLRPKSF